eukprot:gene9847-10857_t
MNRKDKDWAFVNNDGSIKVEKNNLVHASAQVHNETKVDSSDSEQDFEIVSPAKEQKSKKDELVTFKGIFIKEDHFADNDLNDDESDIEVVKKVEQQPDLCEETNQDGKDGGIGLMYEEIVLPEVIIADELVENNIENLDFHFEKVNDEQIEEDDNANDTITISNALKVGFEQEEDSFEFGLSYVSSPLVDDFTAKHTDDVILKERSSESQPKVIVFVNNSMHELNYTTIWISRNAKKHSHDISTGYAKIQEKYESLQKKYEQLQEQYKIQNHVLLLSKKKQNAMKNKSLRDKKLTVEKEYPKVCFQKKEKSVEVNRNATDLENEMFWWKMRTTMWRRKYLDLKVEMIRQRKKYSLIKAKNATFKSCTRLLTQYFPDVDVQTLLKSNAGEKLTTSAKMCWKRVLSPVEIMKEKMKDGIVYFGKNVDDAWGRIKGNWDENTKATKGDSVKERLSSKLRRFRKVFSISNIVGSSLWRKNVNKEGKEIFTKKEDDDDRLKESGGLYCNGDSKIPKDFSKRWQFSSRKEEQVSYPTPIAKEEDKQKLVEQLVNEDKTEEQPNSSFEDEVGFASDTLPIKPCKDKVFKKAMVNPALQEKGEDHLMKKIRYLEKKIKAYSLKEEKDGEKLRELESFKEEKEKIYQQKKRILEEKMRKNSNKYRKEQSLLKDKEEEMKKVVWKLQKDFEILLADGVTKMKNKNRNLKRELKSFKKQNKRQNQKLKSANKKLKAELKRDANMIENMNRKFQEEKERLVKWKETEKEKLMREMASKWSLHEQEKIKWKQRKDALVSKIHKLMKSKHEKLMEKERQLNNKIDALKKALNKLLREEHQKFEEIREKNRVLKQTQVQVEMIKLFYTTGLRKEKEKLQRSETLMKEMKEKTEKLERLYHEIMQKYKSVQGELNRKKPKTENEKSFHKIYYPTVYCPDQKYCQGDEDDHMSGEYKPPSVYCPRKDFCSDWSRVRENEKEMENKETEQSTAVRPIPPNTRQLTKIHSFFIELIGNKTSNEESRNEEKPRKKKPAEPELKKSGEWYFQAMKERENQRGIPFSWYLYWSKGRQSWRTLPGKKDEDNWYLKVMQEREQQRSSPTKSRFKQQKQKEEEMNYNNNNWLFNRGKGRKQARGEKGEAYYCW